MKVISNPMLLLTNEEKDILKKARIIFQNIDDNITAEAWEIVDENFNSVPANIIEDIDALLNWAKESEEI